MPGKKLIKPSLRTIPSGKPAPLTQLLDAAPERAREYPDHPRVGVGGIVIHNGQVLLVRRAHPPLKNKWSVPGGLVEVGERLEDAVEREIKEETGLDVEPLGMIGLFEHIHRDPKPDRRVRYHYLIVDYVSRLRGSRALNSKPPRPRPASDITEAEWVDVEMISLYDLSREATEVIYKAMESIDAGW